MIRYFCPGSMKGENRLLVKDEPVAFDRFTFEASGKLATVFKEFIEYKIPQFY